MKNRIISLVLTVILIISFTFSVSAKVDPEYLENAIQVIGLKPDVVNIFKDDAVTNLSDFDSKAPVVIDGSIAIPAGMLEKHFGAKAERLPDSLTLTLNNQEITFTPDSETAVISPDHNAELPFPVLYQDGEYLLPLRLFADLLGYYIYVDNDNMTILTNREITNSAEITSQTARARIFLTGEMYGEQSYFAFDVPKNTVSAVRTAVINGTSNVNLRETPGGTIIKSLAPGQKVFVLDDVDGWYKIHTKGWIYGYIKHGYLSSFSNEITDMSFGFKYFFVNNGQSRQILFKSGTSGIIYKSSDPTIAMVSSNGIVTGYRPGLATITASYDGETASYVAVISKNVKYNVTESMNISQSGANFIATCEGGQSADGRFYKYQDLAGHWTIGYGHLIKEGEEFPESISKEEAMELFYKDLSSGSSYVSTVNKFMKREGIILNQNQFDALVSFLYNLGSGYLEARWDMFALRAALLAFSNGSEIPEMYIYDGFSTYYHSGGKSYFGLYTRRMDEAEMFVKGDYSRDHSKWPKPAGENWL